MLCLGRPHSWDSAKYKRAIIRSGNLQPERSQWGKSLQQRRKEWDYGAPVVLNQTKHLVGRGARTFVGFQTKQQQFQLQGQRCFLGCAGTTGSDAERRVPSTDALLGYPVAGKWRCCTLSTSQPDPALVRTHTRKRESKGKSLRENKGEIL